MPYKRTPTDEEIAALADQFRPLWRQNEPMRPWLRKHGEALMELVHGDWSWDSVAAALNRAGITYQTGNPWTGYRLRRNYLTAKIPLKFGVNRIGQSLQGKGATGAAQEQPQTPATDDFGSEAGAEEFKPVSLIRAGAEPSQPETATPDHMPNFPRAPAQDVDAVLARFTGRIPPK